MATYVTSLESRVRAKRLDSTSRRGDLGFGLGLVSGLTLFAVAIHGYHPYAEDGGLYLAGVKRLLDPALYPYGTDFVLEPMRHSLFAPVVAAIARLSHAGLPVVLLALHLATVWATLFAGWLMASRCWMLRTARAGAVVLLACWLALPIAGTALLLMDPYLTARSFSTPLTVLALAGALGMTEQGDTSVRQRGSRIWIGSILLAGVMHPLMAAYALGATLILICMRSSSAVVRGKGTAGFAASALVLAALLQAFAQPESAQYLRVALTRTYWFPAEWNWYEWVGLAAPLAILALVARANGLKDPSRGPDREMQARQALASAAIAVGLSALTVAMLFARSGAATHLVARMQPLRAFQIVYLVMVLILGAALGECVLRNVPWRWATAAVLLGGVMFGTSRAPFAHSRHLEFPWTAPRNSWMQAFLWIRDNTPKNALFALDADYVNIAGEDAQCFRAIAERSVLPDYSKDGGEASIAPELASEWADGQAAQKGLTGPAGLHSAIAGPQAADDRRLAALGSLGVSWVVLQSGSPTNFECPYANSAVKVCRLR